MPGRWQRAEDTLCCPGESDAAQGTCPGARRTSGVLSTGAGSTLWRSQQTKGRRTPWSTYPEHSSHRRGTAKAPKKANAVCLPHVGALLTAFGVRHQNKKTQSGPNRLFPPLPSPGGPLPDKEQLWPVCFSPWPVMWWTEHCPKRIWGGTSGKSLRASEPSFLRLRSGS